MAIHLPQTPEQIRAIMLQRVEDAIGWEANFAPYLATWLMLEDSVRLASLGAAVVDASLAVRVAAQPIIDDLDISEEVILAAVEAWDAFDAAVHAAVPELNAVRDRRRNE